MNKINSNDSFIREGVYDPNNILKPSLKPISEAISLLEQGKNPEVKNLFGKDMDDADLKNLISWHEKHKFYYSYPTNKNRILNKYDENIINSIKKSKGKFDIMNLVEISLQAILEQHFKENIRIRKTTDYDDYKSGIDCIVEFLDKNNKVSKIVGIDFTLSNDSVTLDRKKRKETSKPLDYLEYLKNKKHLGFDFIPRLILHIDRDLAYSFTNNYFVQVLEKGDLLDREEIDENFNYAIEDLKKRLEKTPNTIGIKRKISNLVEETKTKAISLFDNF